MRACKQIILPACKFSLRQIVSFPPHPHPGSSAPLPPPPPPPPPQTPTFTPMLCSINIIGSRLDWPLDLYFSSHARSRFKGTLFVLLDCICNVRYDSAGHARIRVCQRNDMRCMLPTIWPLACAIGRVTHIRWQRCKVGDIRVTGTTYTPVHWFCLLKFN